MLDVVSPSSATNSQDWRFPVAERLRIIASQIEAGNINSVIVLSHCGGQWFQDMRYENQFEAVGALEHTKLALTAGRI